MSSAADQLTREEAAKIAKALGGKLLDYSLTHKGAAVLGFLGDYFTLLLTLTTGSDTVVKQLFLKTVPKSHLFLGDGYVERTGMFEKETDLYRVLLNQLREICGVNFCPVYYFSRNYVLVLEDLSLAGYGVPESKVLDMNHLETVLDALSAMHSACFQLEHKMSATLDELYPELFEEIIYDETKPGQATREWLMKGIGDMLAGVKLLPEYSEEQKAVIGKKFLETVMILYPHSKVSDKYRNVLVHGDTWANNFLFKYRDSLPVDVKLVDYQFSRYAPPAHDVMHLLYLTTTESFRKEHENHLLVYYHRRLTTLLDAARLDVASILPLQEFLDSCQHYRQIALTQSLLGLHSITSPKTAFDNLTEFMKGCFAFPAYTDRVLPLLHELINGYILKRDESA